MRPTSRKGTASSNLLQSVGFGKNHTVAKISGNIAKLSIDYRYAQIVAYNKANLQPIAVVRPDANAHYEIHGLNTDLNLFVCVFDLNQEYNAMISDNVVPK